MKTSNRKISYSADLDSDPKNNQVTKVFLMCSGLGHIRRGYESFTQECFDALSQEPSIDVTLFKGGGESFGKEITLWNLPRNTRIASQVGNISHKVIGKGDSYFVEQTTFFLSLLPHLYFKKPDVIFFSDLNLGNQLWQWRRLTNQSYKLLFSNGGPWIPPVFERWDRVQQLAPVHLQTALNLGDPAQKHSLVPYGINISSELDILTSNERLALRAKLELPKQQPLLLSVAAINKYHKRMDYVIREVASLPEPRPFLLLLGQQDGESPEILQLGNQLLGTENFEIRTVAPSEVANYYKIADAFILASLSEGFGRVFLEAMSYGLPCLAHDYEVTQFILEDKGYLANFELTGSLANLIPQALAAVEDASKRHLLHRYTYDRFSWEKLRPDYVNLIQECLH